MHHQSRTSPPGLPRWSLLTINLLQPYTTITLAPNTNPIPLTCYPDHHKYTAINKTCFTRINRCTLMNPRPTFRHRPPGSSTPSPDKVPSTLLRTFLNPLRQCWLFCRVTALLFLASVASADESAAPIDPPLPQAPLEQPLTVDDYERHIRPLLIARCAECHGEQLQEGSLRLDTPAGLVAGGVSGNTIIAGAPERSLLFIAARYKDEALRMPPDEANRLSPAEVNLLARWIQSGAPLPETSTVIAPQKQVDEAAIAAGKEFWSFRPISDPVPPAVADTRWPLTPLDQFILAKLEAARLFPSPAASKPVWLRRVTLTLTGLLPTPQEIESFAADDSPDATNRVIDRLLESPHYGEHWARHWLNVVRYADSNGADENISHGNAWRYRDYVIHAFNSNKPYSQFLVEQLAGDLLPYSDQAQRHAQLTATGMLLFGPKQLAEVDEQKLEMDIIDEQLDTFGRAVLGLTLGCARCHDHKFDPLPTTDYYAIAGVFKSTRSMETFKRMAKWNEHLIPDEADKAKQAAHQSEVERQTATIEALVEAGQKQLLAQQGENGQLPENSESLFPPELAAELKALREKLEQLKKNPPEPAAVMGLAEAVPANLPIHVRGSHLSLGRTIDRGFPQVLNSFAPSIPAEQSGRLQLAEWVTSPSNPLTARVFVNRVWRWHFGTGLVRSVDNFGRLGEPPSHPELLDWLTARFIASGWNVKQLHRLILSSRTYRQASTDRPELAHLDPENRLWGRMNLQRLPAESIRDCLLQAGGLLDETMGGSMLTTKNREHVFDHTSIDKTKYDTRRRSIYLPVIRNNHYDLFSLYDYSDSAVVSGNRDSTVVAPQALFMLNGAVIIEAATALAASIEQQSPANLTRQLDQLFLRALGRQPTSAEQAAAAEFISQVQATALETPAASTSAANAPHPSPLALLCQAVLASNEFLYYR